MSDKTGKGLAKYALLQLGKPYWWGTFGQTASASLYAAKKKQYPDYYTAADFPLQYGQRVHDCVGLIKGYLWSETPSSPPVYNGSQDVSVSGLYQVCDQKGDLSTMPDELGVCVFMANMGHVGVYAGNGHVIEAMGHAYGVVQTDLRSRGWAKWGKPRWIDYDSEQEPLPAPGPDKPNDDQRLDLGLPTVTRGSTGRTVRAMQAVLINLGYGCGPCGADGEYGSGTYAALCRFQSDNGLEPDGICGPRTWYALLIG